MINVSGWMITVKNYTELFWLKNSLVEGTVKALSKLMFEGIKNGGSHGNLIFYLIFVEICLFNHLNV